MTNRFPLLCLPQNALKSVLRSMEPLDLILFSFSSNRAKSLVASINMKSRVKVAVSNIFTIIASAGQTHFQFQFYYHEVKNGAIPIKMSNPDIVYLTIYGEGMRCVIPKDMDIPSWFSHIRTIFNCSKRMHLQFYEAVGNFDLDSLSDCIVQEGFDNDCSLWVYTRNSDEYNRKIVKTFRNVKHLSLETEVYENGKPPGEVLIQNFSRFKIGFQSIGPTTMKLDDILMMNSKQVILYSKLTEKDANKFLKLWMRGNSKLKYFGLNLVNEINVDPDTVLKGIKFQEIPLEVKRFFDGVEDPIEGGIDVIRRDGTRGTIKRVGRYMKFYIWHDHCKVEK